MMAKEKASELFAKMYHADDIRGNYPMCFNSAKQCALIAVDEIINECIDIKERYWQEVKTEIQKL
jgi:hypothetical protein